MPTYIFAERDGNAALTISEDSEEKAIEYLEAITKHPKGWRLDGEEED